MDVPALSVFSAVGDAFAGRRLGVGLRRAAAAARFARFRQCHDAAVAASFLAGMLADIGGIDLVIEPNASERLRTLALADVPLRGARLIRTLGLPTIAGDMVRWHREHDDGTGYPDRLRWDGIPDDAAALGIISAFLDLIEDAREPRDPAEAVFTIAAESGRRFRLEMVRSFRMFVLSTPDWDASLSLPGVAVDTDAVLALIATRIDARDDRTVGRSERLARLASTLAVKLGADPLRATRLVHLHANGRAGADPADLDAVDPLSRFARDRRTAEAARAARIASMSAAYADDARLLTMSASPEPGTDKLANIIALTIAADGLDAGDAPRRIAAAAGPQFDPAVAHAYLTIMGAVT
jgi:hypothetical protein